MRQLDSAARQVAHGLNQKGLTIAAATATAGGRLGYLLTSHPGSSSFFLGGISPYSRESSIDVLRVDRRILEAHGSVSPEAALEMARQVRQRFHADLGLAETGIAGPSGGTSEKPVGLVFVALCAGPGSESTQSFQRSGDREENRRRFALAALDLAALDLAALDLAALDLAALDLAALDLAPGGCLAPGVGPVGWLSPRPLGV